MPAMQPIITAPERTPVTSFVWSDILLGLLLGIAGGLLQATILHLSLISSSLLGAAFGVVFGLVFAKRASSAGAGLIWGISSALLLWFVMLAVSMAGKSESASMLQNARLRFPELVAFLLCLGFPVGLVFGVRGGMRRELPVSTFRLSRAIVGGGFAGVISGLIFGYWMVIGGFFPLIAGLNIQSASHRILLQFCLSFSIGATFGLLFQRDVRGYGSSMGWGLGYVIFWWFAGPLTLFPLVQRMPLNWSIAEANPLFGALVGHILYGLILGVIYSTIDRGWVRLFIQSDP